MAAALAVGLSFNAAGCFERSVEEYSVAVQENSGNDSGVSNGTVGDGGANLDDVAAPCTAHTWDEGVITGAPTTKKAGVRTYTCTVCGETKTEAILKLNPLTVRPVKVTCKAAVLKKAKQTFTIKATKAQGKVTYSLNKAARAAKMKVSGKGKIVIPKKCGAGTYKVTVKARGNKTFQPGSKTVKITVK